MVDAYLRSLGIVLTGLSLVGLLGTATNARANESDTVESLLTQIQSLTERIEMLESRTAIATATYQQPKPTISPPAKENASWTDKVKLNGDFRYRHEAFDVEGLRDRHRQRLRARAAMVGQVSERVEVGFGLASGNSFPNSTNQTLDDGFSSKNVVLDLAYAKWDTPIQGLGVTAGKFKNPVHRAGGTGLIFDGDLHPEGLGLKYENSSLFASGLATWVDESGSDDDSFLLGGQVGIERNLGNGELTAGMSYYNFIDARGEPTFFTPLLPLGNRTNPDGTYLSGFELVEGFAEYAFEIDGRTLSFFADYVHNMEADDFETGYTLGAKLKASKWQFGYAYQDLEADAVVGIFTDSDFAGGGTDGKGHILQGSYSLTKAIGLNGTLFLNERNMDFGTSRGFNRLMLDISFKY